MISRRPPTRNVFAILAVAAVTSGGTGCGNPFGATACFEIGCDSGIRLTFDAPPPAGTIIELDSSSGFPWRLECGVDWNCDFDPFFYGFTPEHVTVRVVTSTGEVTASVRPKYLKFQPNGEDCPPTCRVASIMIELPA